MVLLEQRTIEDDWYRRSFGAYYPVLYSHRTVDAAAPEVAFAAEQLKFDKHTHVLDLCCGTGRHMVHLNRTAGHVTGLDYSSELLRIASGLLREGVRARLVRGDMRRLPFGTAFDVVTSFFTSFGYFPHDEENEQTAREMARVLRPGGCFLMDHINAENVEKTLAGKTERQHNGYDIFERRWIDDGRVKKETQLFRDGVLLGKWGESVQLYRLEILKALLGRCGLLIDRVFGDYQGSPMGPDRPRMIVVGHKG